jgi:hypothetical protein
VIEVIDRLECPVDDVRNFGVASGLCRLKATRRLRLFGGGGSQNHRQKDHDTSEKPAHHDTLKLTPRP